MEFWYFQQYRRMQINYDKLAEFYSSSLSNIDISGMNEIKNLAITFFESCYHLKDWIKKENIKNITNNSIEEYINNSTYLKICADIANQSKHRTLTKSRSGQYKIPINVNSKIDFINKKAIQTCSITFQGEKLDVLNLAKKCINEWDIFLKQNKLFKTNT